MDYHHHARLTVHGRELLCRAVVQGRLSLCEATAEHRISRQTAAKWGATVPRRRNGSPAGSRFAASPLRQLTSPELLARVQTLRRERWGGPWHFTALLQSRLYLPIAIAIFLALDTSRSHAAEPQQVVGQMPAHSTGRGELPIS